MTEGTKQPTERSPIEPVGSREWAHDLQAQVEGDVWTWLDAAERKNGRPLVPPYAKKEIVGVIAAYHAHQISATSSREEAVRELVRTSEKYHGFVLVCTKCLNPMSERELSIHEIAFMSALAKVKETL